MASSSQGSSTSSRRENHNNNNNSKPNNAVQHTFDDNDETEYHATIGNFKPGSITQIHLRNFMTHSELLVHPGPRLNMVIGANGTGKSTILNAICLGLGGDPKLLGRADDLRAFIRHGASAATIDITLQAWPGRPTHTLRRVLDAERGSQSDRSRGRGSSIFYINGELVSIKQIRHLVKTVYQISVDNLCTFLPQDKVGDFSGLTDQCRLLETEKTLSAGGVVAVRDDEDGAPNEDYDGTVEQHTYYDKHMELIELEGKISTSQGDVTTVQDQLKKYKHELELLQREKDRMEERKRAEEQVELCRKKMLWLEFEEMREKALELRDRKQQNKERLAEAQEMLRPLQEKHQQMATAVKQFATLANQYEQEVGRRKQELKKQAEKYQNHDDKIDEITAELNTLETQRNKREEDYAKALESLQKYETMREEAESLETINKLLTETNTQLKQTKHEYNQVKLRWRTTSDRLKELESEIERERAKLVKLQDGAKLRKERILREDVQLGEVFHYIEKNRSDFRRPVWGPIACELNPKSNNAASFLEFHVPNRILKAIVVETEEDYKKVRDDCKKMGKNVNIIKVDHGRLKPFSRLYSDEKMKILKDMHGVGGYLDEFFTAPDPVMQALISYGGVNRVLVGGSETHQSINQKDLLGYLIEPDATSANPQKRPNAIIFSSESNRSFRFTVSKSRYASTSNIQQDEVRPARMLAPGANPRIIEESEALLSSLHRDMDTCRPELQSIQQEMSERESASQALNVKLEHYKKQKDSIQKLQSKIDRARHMVAECKEAMEKDCSDERKKLVVSLFSRMTNSISALAMHEQERKMMLKAAIAGATATLSRTKAKVSENKALEALNEKQAEFQDIVREANDVNAAFSKIKQDLKNVKQRADTEAPIEDSDGNPLPLKQQLEELSISTLDEARVALEDSLALIKSIHANDGVFRQYESLKKHCEETEIQLDLLSRGREVILNQIQEKRKQWENPLRNFVAKINIKFGQYMQEMGCTGEVRLKRGQDGETDSSQSSRQSESDFANFKEWGIEILVSYRDNTKAQILSAQHHSGGERSVATILYLMALQDMMVAPFRCVDEINQGLDERNERLVFNRIVMNSTNLPRGNALNHSGQYFLITPKLLPNLTGMENEGVTVHIIFNGSFCFDKPTDWNVERMLAVSKRPNDAALSAEQDENDNSSCNVPIRKVRKLRK